MSETTTRRAVGRDIAIVLAFAAFAALAAVAFTPEEILQQLLFVAAPGAIMFLPATIAAGILLYPRAPQAARHLAGAAQFGAVLGAGIALPLATMDPADMALVPWAMWSVALGFVVVSASGLAWVSAVGAEQIGEIVRRAKTVTIRPAEVDPVEVLRRRLANGEIGNEEYERTLLLLRKE